MQDEHFQRQWTLSHDRFSHDMDTGFQKLRGVLTAVRMACGPALLRKADATAKAAVLGFVSGAVLGSALLANADAPAPKNAAAQTETVGIGLARLVLARAVDPIERYS